MGGDALQGGDGIRPDVLARLEAEYTADETPFVLATVVRCVAPTSAQPGDRAIVTRDGRLQGWIGGACAEPLIRHEAVRALDEGTPRLIHIAPAEDTVRTQGGGEVTVATTCPSGGTLDIFIEPRLPRPLLMVFGASPVAQTLVAIAGTIGFRTCVVHMGAVASDFPAADSVLGELDLKAAARGADSWAIVASMGHYDEEALACVLAAEPALDVGLVASRRRARSVLAALRDQGIDEAQLSRIRTPAGGERATTQAEIALLALAEIVTLRSARSKARPAAPIEIQGLAEDPVCHMSVDIKTATHTATHEGRTYYFCSAGCKAQFEADTESTERP